MEQPDNHKLVDEISRTTHCSLRGLRDRDYFYSDDVHYALAASFTGFLLRRFGWNAYRNLYRSSGVAFKAAFKTELGISFSNAEREWRQELLTQSVSR